MDNNSFGNHEDQFVLSHELVQLMDWIVKYNPEGLKKVIEVARSRAYAKKITKNKRVVYDSDIYEYDELQDSIMNFFELLEKSLLEVENESISSSVIQKHLLPAMERVDVSACDELMVNDCATVAANKVKKQPSRDAEDLFLKELLKRWKPRSSIKNKN